MIINLPKNLEKETTHRYSANSFKLHRLPVPRPGQVPSSCLLKSMIACCFCSVCAHRLHSIIIVESCQCVLCFLRALPRECNFILQECPHVLDYQIHLPRTVLLFCVASHHVAAKATSSSLCVTVRFLAVFLSITLCVAAQVQHFQILLESALLCLTSVCFSVSKPSRSALLASNCTAVL